MFLCQNDNRFSISEYHTRSSILNTMIFRCQYLHQYDIQVDLVFSVIFRIVCPVEFNISLKLIQFDYHLLISDSL